MVASPTRTRTVTHPRQHPHPNDAALLQSAFIRTIRVPDACPPSISQGCTLGWYALTLWVKWNPALSQGCALGWYALTLWVKQFRGRNPMRGPM